MPLPVSVQLGVELTSFVAPLSKAVFKLGTLAAREAIERSGSDELTELKLAHILGQFRLDPAISIHFRSVVARSNWTALSRFAKDLVLEPGSGPTVSQALASENPALLSMIVQVSFLAWSHETQSLGQSIIQIIDEGYQEREGSTSHGLNYVALLGTIAACQQQTAAFSWDPHYKAVEEKFKSPSRGTTSTKHLRKRSKTSSSKRTAADIHPSVSHRGIPFVILGGLLRSLESLQRLPDEHLLELSSDQGVSSLVIWCYHILGLSVTVNLDDQHFYFGDEPYNISIKSCKSSLVSAILLQRTSENEPLFTLQKADFDPYIQSETRAPAKGFLRTILERQQLDTDNIEGIRDCIVSMCVDHLGRSVSCHPSFGSVSYDVEPSAMRGCLQPRTQELRDEILPSVSFLLDIELQSSRHQPSKPWNCNHKRTGFPWSLVLLLVYAFARVPDSDRQECGSIPLSVTNFERLTHSKEQALKVHGVTQVTGPIPDVVHCFGLLSELLLGLRYTSEYSSEAFLLSDRGWSIFFTTMDAVDPAEVDRNRFHIRLGVPARNGIRKTRIVDGMLHHGLSSTRGHVLSDDVNFWPGVWTSKLAGTHIGYEGQDAFTVVQTYDWAQQGPNSKKWRLGFREKQEMCMHFHVLAKCLCGNAGQSESDQRHAIEELVLDSGDHSLKVEYPVSGHPPASETPERVLRGPSDNWYFFGTGDGSARWLGLEGLDGQIDSKHVGYIRGPECCVSCAIKAVDSHGLVLL